MRNIKIEKLDNEGRGICYIDNKITFVFNALPEEIVDIKIIKSTTKFNEAIVTNYIKTNKNRISSICPYFNKCGGCNLMHLKYSDTCQYKLDKIKNILYKYSKITPDLEFIPSKQDLEYRNKITLKINNKEIGYYKESTHELLSIKNCLLAEKTIQNIIPDLKCLDITNGEVTIRNNYNNELLIIINTKDKINPNISYLKQKHKIVGIILNDKPLIGESHFIEIINNKLFNVSYDSFFQINRYICSEIFNILNKYIKKSDIVLDLYCGVGTLGINVAQNAKKLYGIEIIPNAIINSTKNAKLNKIDNAFYLLGDVSKCITKIKDNIDTIIVDPPRAGIDHNTIETILRFNPQQIIYISCNIMTLARDLNILKENYNIEKVIGLDMFPYTHHVESLCVLNRR